MIAKIFIKKPKTVKHLIQSLGIKISATATIVEIINRGRRFIRIARGFSPQIKPATKLPMGIVAIPQSIPKKSSLCWCCLTMPSENGRVKDITHPIIEDITKAL